MARVGERYQLVIEKAAREQLGVRPGARAVESVEDGRLVVTFLPERHRRSLRGRLAGHGHIDDLGGARDAIGPMIVEEELARPARVRRG